MRYEGLHVIDFRDGSIILLHGDTGAGKTTIFSAIDWCLYGVMKDIEPLDTETVETYVCMEFDDIIIYRKRPKEFKVTICEGVFVDAAAQGIINRLFGDRDLWRATSYIEQENHSILINGTNKEKKAVLKSLSSSEVNVKNIIETIDKELKEAESILESNRNLTLHKIQNYNNLLGGVPIIPNTLFSEFTLVKPDLTHFCSNEKLNEMITNYQNLFNSYNLLQQQQLNQSHDIGVRTTLQHQLNCTIEKVQHIPEEKICIDLLTQANLQLYEAENLLVWINEKSILEKDINNLQTIIQSISPSNISFTDIDYNKALQTEFLYNKNLDLCKSINMLYDKSTLNHIENFNKSIELMNQLIQLLPHRLEVRKLEKSLQIDTSKNYSIEDYNKVIEREKALNYGKMICSKYNLTFCQDTVVKELHKLYEINNIYCEYEPEVQIFLSKYKNFEMSISPQDLDFSFEELEEKIKQVNDYVLRHQRNKSILLANSLSEYLTSTQIREYEESVRAFLASQEILRVKNKTKLLAISYLQNLQMKFSEIPQEKNKLGQSKVEKIQERDKLVSELAILDSSANVLICPHCSTSLQLIQNKLELSNVSWIDNLEKVKQDTRLKLTQVNEEINKITSKLEQIYKFTELNFTEFDIPESISIEENDKYKIILNHLSQLDYNYISPPDKTAEYYEAVFSAKIKKFFTDKNIDVELIINTKEDPIKMRELESIHEYTEPEISANEIYTHIMNMKQFNHLNELRSKTSNFESMLIQYCKLQNKSLLEEDTNVFYSELNELQKKLNVLNRIELIELPVHSSTEIQKSIQLNKYKSEYDFKLTRLQEINKFTNGKIVNTDISFLRNEVLLKSTNLETRRSSDIIIKNLTEQLSKLIIDDTLDERIKISYTQIQNLYTCIEESKKAINIKTQHDNLLIEITDMADLENYVIGLNRLKTEAPVSESICLQYTVEKINKILDTTLTAMFSHPITVKMVLAKELKTQKGKLKMGVNYEISYNNKSYKSINQVSVGERKRISLAILIAINMFSKSRLVLIDEAGACLDAKHKSNMIEALKQLKYMGKTVYCIDHESVAGFYDDYHHVTSVS